MWCCLFCKFINALPAPGYFRLGAQDKLLADDHLSLPRHRYGLNLLESKFIGVAQVGGAILMDRVGSQMKVPFRKFIWAIKTVLLQLIDYQTSTSSILIVHDGQVQTANFFVRDVQNPLPVPSVHCVSRQPLGTGLLKKQAVVQAPMCTLKKDIVLRRLSR